MSAVAIQETYSEVPLIFTAESVRAILAGEKTQTRRLVDLKRTGKGGLHVDLPACVQSDGHAWMPADMRLQAPAGRYLAHLGDAGAVSVYVVAAHRRSGGKPGDPNAGDLLGVKPGEFHFVCPYANGPTHLGNYGERVAVAPEKPKADQRWTVSPKDSRLWVKETWRTHERPSDGVDGILFAGDQHFARIENTAAAADRWMAAHDNGKHGERWRSPIYLPRWASRIDLQVVGVRLERLHDISEDDAHAEGVTAYDGRLDERLLYAAAKIQHADPADARVWYAVAWDLLNGHRATWASNPWVWQIEFRRLPERT